MSGNTINRSNTRITPGNRTVEYGSGINGRVGDLDSLILMRRACCCSYKRGLLKCCDVTANTDGSI